MQWFAPCITFALSCESWVLWVGFAGRFSADLQPADRALSRTQGDALGLGNAGLQPAVGLRPRERLRAKSQGGNSWHVYVE